MATNYGQTILGAWDQAGAMDLRNQQARAAQRINDQNQYADVWNRLQTQGIIDIAKEGPNRGYATFNMERAMEVLPKGGLANYLDFALRKSNLTKYEGADGRLKQGKIVGVHKITAEEDPANAGMYAIAIKNERGRMSFLSRDRKEGGKDPLLLDAEDIQRYADIGARAILARTPQASQVTYGMMADDLESMKKKNQRDDAVSALATTKREADLASIGLNPDETIDLNSPVSRRIAAEGQILTTGEGHTEGNAGLQQTGAIETVYADSKTGKGPNITGDNEKRDRNGKPIPPRPELRTDDKGITWGAADQKAWDKKYGPGGTLVAKEAKEAKEAGEAKVEWNDPNKLWKDNPKWRQHNMGLAMKEIERELGRPEKQTAIAQDMFGAAGSPAGKQVQKVFDHLGLPTKSGLVTKDHWRQARDYMMSLKGDPTAKTVTGDQGPAMLMSTTNNAETVEEAEAVIATKIDRQEKPESEEVQKLRELLEANEVKTLEDYKKIAAEKLSPQDLIAANWIVASIGTKTMAEVQNNMTMLSNITATGFPDYSYQEMIDDKNTAYSQVTARMNAMSSAAGKAMSNTDRQNQFLEDIEPTYALRRDFTLDMESGRLSNADGEVIDRDQHRQKMSLTIENLRRSLNNGTYGPRGSADYITATKEIDKQTAQFIQHAAAQQEGVRFTGDKIKDFFINPDTPFYVDGGLKNLRIKNTRRGAMFVYGTTDYRGNFNETDNSILVGGIIATVFGSDEEFMRFVERNQIKNADTNEVWTN